MPAFDRYHAHGAHRGSRLVETFGKPMFQYMLDNPDSAARFHAAMSSGHGKEDDALAEVIDFSGVTHGVDVGGGNGSLLSAILKRNDHIAATLFETDSALAAARSGAGGPLPSWGKVQDFTMLIAFVGGMERTSEEYAELLAEAGLRLDHVQEISPETASVVSEAD